MDESAFIAAADATLDKIGLALDAALETSDADLDWNLKDGVLTIECEDGSRIIVNRHVPNREIWVAAKSGGFHFRPDERAVARRARGRRTRDGARTAPEDAGGDSPCGCRNCRRRALSGSGRSRDSSAVQSSSSRRAPRDRAAASRPPPRSAPSD